MSIHQFFSYEDLRLISSNMKHPHLVYVAAIWKGSKKALATALQYIVVQTCDALLTKLSGAHQNASFSRSPNFYASTAMDSKVSFHQGEHNSCSIPICISEICILGFVCAHVGMRGCIVC